MFACPPIRRAGNRRVLRIELRQPTAASSTLHFALHFALLHFALLHFTLLHFALHEMSSSTHAAVQADVVEVLPQLPNSSSSNIQTGRRTSQEGASRRLSAMEQIVVKYSPRGASLRERSIAAAAACANSSGATSSLASSIVSVTRSEADRAGISEREPPP